ncbi:hypothetical protein CASFOL_032937 [Castilleja foliolosa]|uniref:[Phosphatase 2A protein]-leucine-carboxy methyltransferase 1 n=1 Tax=Castilleja foliolosa TaxID=1961234 RepID=A0ABD3C415_9LAMI
MGKVTLLRRGESLGSTTSKIDGHGSNPTSIERGHVHHLATSPHGLSRSCSFVVALSKPLFVILIRNQLLGRVKAMPILRRDSMASLDCENWQMNDCVDSDVGGKPGFSLSEMRERCLPIFIIAEFVLIYLDPESSHDIVGRASRTFPTAIFFLYEQIHPADAFEQQMIRNLEGCALLGIHRTKEG